MKGLYELAIKLNKKLPFFYSIKKVNPAKYNFIFSFDDDVEKSFFKYKEREQEIIAVMQKITLELEENRKIKPFGLSVGHNSFHNILKDIFLERSNLLSFKVLKVFAKAILMYQYYRKDNISKIIYTDKELGYE